MANSQTQPEPVKFSGSMKVGRFTAQLFVEIAVTPTTLSLNSSGQSFRIDRENSKGLEETAILGIFKRGIRFHHCQPGLAAKVFFYPYMDRDTFREKLNELGWS